jgi:hypothetical protein
MVTVAEFVERAAKKRQISTKATRVFLFPTRPQAPAARHNTGDVVHGNVLLLITTPNHLRLLLWQHLGDWQDICRGRRGRAAGRRRNTAQDVATQVGRSHHVDCGRPAATQARYRDVDRNRGCVARRDGQRQHGGARLIGQQLVLSHLERKIISFSVSVGLLGQYFSNHQKSVVKSQPYFFVISKKITDSTTNFWKKSHTKFFTKIPTLRLRPF